MKKPGKPRTAYLKQLDLCEMPSEVSEHHESLQEMESGLSWWGTSLLTYLWMGSRGCLTGLHSDDEDNFLVQCQGSKRVYLCPPTVDPKDLYVNDKYDSGTVCCDVDVFQVNLKTHPRFKAVCGKEVELQAGDVLFIPAFWWHSVLTTSHSSMSLNSFVSRPLERLRRGLGRNLAPRF